MIPKDKILDIAMNLNRVGNWAADDYKGKKKRIVVFLDQTSEYIDSLDKSSFSIKFKKTFKSFVRDYKNLEQQGKSGPKNPLDWAEQMMTWGNILTHRAKLI